MLCPPCKALSGNYDSEDLYGISFSEVLKFPDARAFQSVHFTKFSQVLENGSVSPPTMKWWKDENLNKFMTQWTLRHIYAENSCLEIENLKKDQIELNNSAKAKDQIKHYLFARYILDLKHLHLKYDRLHKRIS